MVFLTEICSQLSEAYLCRLPDKGQGEDFRLVEEGDV